MLDGTDKGRVCDTEWPGLVAVEAMASLNGKAVAAVIDFNGTLCARMSAISGGWAAFIGKRLEEHFKLSQQVAACRSPEQLLDVYGSFLQKAFEQYQAEFAHMLKLGQAFVLRMRNFSRSALRQHCARRHLEKPCRLPPKLNVRALRMGANSTRRRKAHRD